MGTNTGLGIGIGIPFKNNALGGDKPYFPPELKARMIGVWTNYGKKNTDADRNIIKNKIPNAGGDLEILNAAYKLNSGFGEYSEDFTTWTKSSKITSVNSESFSFASNVIYSLLYYKSNIGKDIPSFKIRIKLDKKGGDLYYNYINSEGRFINTIITGEEYVTPVSYNTKYIGKTPVNCGFSVTNITSECSGTITQIPNFEDAFVSDGINDMIVSQKTLQEMGVTKELTIVSMIHQISWRGSASVPLTNYIRPKTNEYVRSHVSNIGKTGIYGYVCYDISNSGAGNSHVVNTILGDKNDYSINIVGDLSQGKFSVQGYIDDNGNILETSSVAHYWTFAVLGKATEDEINLIIGNYNLDRSLKPDILCNIGKQGITNDNHADFNDKLIDYSGNGRDIQMNNLAWKGGSGIAAKQYETFKDWTNTPYQTSTVTEIDEFTRVVDSTSNAYWVSMINRTSDFDKVHDSINIVLYQDDMLLVHECKYKIDENVTTKALYETLKSGVNTITLATIDKFTDIPEDAEIMSLGEWVNPKSNKGSVKITLLPSYKGGLLLDGVNDFGKVTGMPIYKDYTFIIDYERISYASSERWVAGVVSKSHIVNQGAFILMTANREVEPVKQTYSFGGVTSLYRDDFTRALVYQNKYKFGDVNLTVGEGVDGDTLWLGTLRNNDSRFFNGVIYSLMSFPYSMSEFLIERQLKKHKLGTLYPNMVEFRPIIKGGSIFKYLNVTTNEEIFAGDYIHVGDTIRFYVSGISGTANEVSSFTVNGVEGIPKGNNGDLFDAVVTKSPQKINITIDEYIRFEDIVQPYPVLLRFNDENGNEVSWGGKFRVGSTITRIGSIADPESNLLNGLYSVSGLSLNGKAVTSSTSIVEKQMVFKTTATWLLDNNKPKCILSPSRLRIPNSSYKILGHIPDISGHGNHGVINNSAYAKGSGVNEDGSYQFDGVDDFVTIPTLSSGGKQVLMKVNWDKTITYAILYDQRGYPNEFAIYNADVDNNNNPVFAYQARNNGQTYIDGILNKNIKASELRAITHNITITNELSTGTNTSSPVIGSNRVHDAYFTNMALYDFMLFDNISTDDKIKELNEYVGVEAKVELPPYYWDTYGKTNLDADKATIQQRGVAIGDYDLTNYNHVYEGMSGYNGYPVVFGANKTWEILSSAYGYISDVTSTTIHVTMVKNAGTGLLFSYVKKDEALTNIKEIPAFRVTIKGLEGNSKFGYRYLATEDATGETLVYLGNGTHELAKSFAPTKALLDLTYNAWVGIFITPMVEGEVVFDCDITIEVLPEYENGLVYDGVEDFSDNKNVPLIDDFTVIAKRTWLEENTSDKPFIIKGDTLYPDGNKNAFLFEYGKLSTYSFGQNNKYDESVVPSLISWATSTSYNGTTSLVRGSAIDTVGIDIAHATKIVLYKLILYPKTIPLLQINFLKNLMEKDEIIDLTNPIFIKNE